MLNRRGAPDSSLALSQRELNYPPVWWQTHEDSGMSLRLAWRVAPVTAGQPTGSRVYTVGNEVPWLDDESKIRALGIRSRHPKLPSELGWNSGSPHLQEARVLPLLRRPAHGRDRGAVGR